ncbi:hypothetical protein [Sandaracinobacteroides hominis]|uniref:hypothetical protein n=1 Tax=Sandaracinobacteroides hominis TaxID=2780086 RepID=UPI0018F6C62A|nr:hypothetical protein [Sandaracinobacteroides hominis]
MRRWTTVALVLLLPACTAQNALTVERGGALVAAGAPATAASRALLNEVAATSREASIELAVADRGCRWPEVRIATAPEASGLCAKAAEPGVDFVVIDRARLSPTISLIDGLVAYLSSVDDIVSEAPDDSGTMLSNALIDAQGIAGVVSSVAGVAEPRVTDEQREAAAGLVGLIGTLAQERDQAARLRQLEGKSGDVSRTITLLETDLNNWAKLALQSDLDTVDAAFLTRSRQLSRNAPDTDYRAFLTNWAELKDRRDAAGALPTELSKALNAMQLAHADYDRILQNRNLTAADRKEMARIARARLSQALSSVAAVLRAFL